MIPEVLHALSCPVCQAPFLPELRCDNGHAYDRARQGYVNLLAGRDPGTGDTAEMVARRAAFLAEGHYAPVADLLPAASGLVVEVGAGTGYYLGRVLDRSPHASGLALDLSKYAARRAARAHPRAVAAVADCWGRLPLHDGSADLVLDVFAPRNAAEFARVLRPGGRLAVVTPLPEHLAELREPLGLIAMDPVKDERTAAALEPWFDLDDERVLRRTMRLDHAGAADLFGMGPSAVHADQAGRIAVLPAEVEVTLAVRLGLYAPSPRGRTPPR